MLKQHPSSGNLAFIQDRLIHAKIWVCVRLDVLIVLIILPVSVVVVSIVPVSVATTLASIRSTAASSASICIRAVVVSIGTSLYHSCYNGKNHNEDEHFLVINHDEIFIQPNKY